MVINGQWQGPPAPAYQVPDQYRPPANQRSMPTLRHPNDAPPPPLSSSALRPRAPSNPARQFFPVFPPRTTSNARQLNGPPQDIGIQLPMPPLRNASLPQPNNFYPPPRTSSAATRQMQTQGPPPRTSSRPAEQPFAIAGTTPPPHLPLRQQASQNLRLGRSNSHNRLLDPRTGLDLLAADPTRRPRPHSAELSPSSSPAHSPRRPEFFPPATASSASSSLEPPPSTFSHTPRPFVSPDGQLSDTSSQISLASAPAARPPPAHQTYAVGNAFRSTSTPHPFAEVPQRPYGSRPEVEQDGFQSSQKTTTPWREQIGSSSLRESLHSAQTTGSSAVDQSGTDRSSIVTSRSSSSEVNQQGSNWPKIREQNAEGEEVISVDDYLDMYARGFDTSPAVTATDYDIPAVPPLPMLQKDPTLPRLDNLREDLTEPSSGHYPGAESLPPITVQTFGVTSAEHESSTNNGSSTGTLRGDEPIFGFGTPHEVIAESVQPANNMLKVTEPLPAMRRVESLMPEPPPEDPPTPEPPQIEISGSAHSFFDTSHTISPPLDEHQTLARLRRSVSTQSSLAQTASLHSKTASTVERHSQSFPLRDRARSFDSTSTRPSSLKLASMHDDPTQSEPGHPDLFRPDLLQEQLRNFDPPRISSYLVESPYSEETTQPVFGQEESRLARSTSLAPPSNMPRPESSYGDSSALPPAMEQAGADSRPLTAPTRVDTNPPEPPLANAPAQERPYTAPRMAPIEERPPMPPMPSSNSTQSSPVQSPVQSPLSARFPSGSQASSAGSPALKKTQPDWSTFRHGSQASFAGSPPLKMNLPERGSFRPAPRARMMAPPMKVGAMGPGGLPRPFATGPRTSAQIMAGLFDASDAARQSEEEQQSPHRDRYGFKKQSQYVKEEQYDAWNLYYAVYLERRRNKWNELMMSNGCSIDKPTTFPPKSDKVKRYVRKGIPPEWRGAAWFFYAGGPARVAKDPQLYRELASRGDRGHMSEQDREHIERDLNRTFPDNVKFKADPEPEADKRSTMMSSRPNNGSNNRSTLGTASTTSRDSAQEQPMIRSLRRVLRAFAIHCPKIGYCQSLNFLAGQLLLFLDGDEEKAFHLLCVLTSEHLPGTHGFALEGANVDIGVLMQSLRDMMPSVWAKLDDRAGSNAKTGLGDMRTQTGLPTVSLATTAWFMSCFVGTLPVESACRVWDCLFYEGSKTLFRVALGIFRLGEPEIRRLSDPMEIFQVVQTLPRHLIDANALMEASFGKSLEGRGLLSQGVVERRRTERRNVYNAETMADLQAPPMPQDALVEGDKEKRGLSRGIGTLRRLKSRKGRT